MDSNTYFSVPFLSLGDLQQKADNFRDTYYPNGQLPVNIFDIVELGLRLDVELLPLSTELPGIEIRACILGDLKTIIVDAAAYTEERSEAFMRFCLAHEVGHLVLHREWVENRRPSSIAEWKQQVMDATATDYVRVEYQANEFAGRLVVPRNELLNTLEVQQPNIAQARREIPDLEPVVLANKVARTIGDRFGVSHQVIVKRFEREGLMPRFS